jgi:hypothetical protein
MKDKKIEVSLEEFVKLLYDTDGRVFQVSFIKRSTGETRNITAKFGVTDKLKGGKQPYDPAKKLLITVFDVDKNDYRAIPAEGIISGFMDGKEYIVKDRIGRK